MAADSRFSILNDMAVSQDDRLKAAPAPESFNVDDRSLAQLLAFGARYGALINFYDLDDRQDGSWYELFARDPAVSHALHASLDLTKFERLFHDLVEELRRSEAGHRRAHELRRVLETVEQLLRILDRSHGAPGGMLRYLGGPKATPRSAAVRGPLHRLHRHLGDDWLARRLEQALEEAASEWLAELATIIEDLGDALIDELRKGVESAQAELEASLASPLHAPQAALYNTFILQFIEARAALNTFPRRLVDFYYDDVLRQPNRAAEPDQLFLTFTPADPTKPASVQRGAIFSAGEDSSGQAINYVSELTLEVAPVSVEELSVHSLAYAGRPGKDTEPSGVLSGVVKLKSSEAFPLFGATQPGELGSLSLEPANIGFTVATPTLMAQSGERVIEIGFLLSASQASKPPRSAAGIIGPDIAALASRARALLAETGHLYYSTANAWVLVQDLHIEVTTPPDRPHGAMLVLRFKLPADAPPLVATSTKPDPEAPPILAVDAPSPSGSVGPNAPPAILPASAFPQRTTDPAVVCAVKLDNLPANGASPGEAPANPFAFLSELLIEEVQVDVCVEGLTNLKLNTPNGAVDPSQAFAVFGLPPAQYSTLEIQSAELFVKPVIELSVSIEWAGIPVTSTGFAGYYQGYVLDADGEVSPTPLFDNASFQVGFSVKNPGLWKVGDQERFLFQTMPPPPPFSDLSQPPPAPNAEAPLDTSSTLVAEPEPQDLPAYYSPAASSLLLKLTEPAYAFGDVLFTPNVMAAASAMTAASIAAASKPPPGSSGPPAPPPLIPNPPWRPVASSLTVNYRARCIYPVGLPRTTPPRSGPPPSSAPAVAASDVIDFWQIGTFNEAQTPDPAQDGGVNLISKPEPHAALYIQLSAKAPTVSLLFVLTAGQDGWWKQEPKLYWQQRVGKRWKRAILLSDTTNNFSNSGIVTLALETGDDVNAKPRLRVVSHDVSPGAPYVKQVIANAVTAQWTGPGGAANLGSPLAADTITKSLSTLTNVGSISQPMESFGGCPPLQGQSLQMWLAERLRHKEFGIDAWDYARLALEEAPALWQAVVVPATDGSCGQPAAGAVWVVVVAGPNTPDVADTTAPTVDFTAMSTLANVLTTKISPFVELTVTNPPYLRLEVDAECVFANEDTPDFWSQRLNKELVRWLSPWPPTDLGVRPTDYYTEHAIAEFIRHRPYVRGVTRLRVGLQQPTTYSEHYYLTSAQSHQIGGVSEDDEQAAGKSARRLRRTHVRGSI